MNDEELSDELKHIPIPEADAAEERAWLAVKASYRERDQGDARRVDRSRRWSLGRRTAGALAATVVAVFVISPAGATVRDWVGDTLQESPTHPRPSLTSLPSGGELLVESSKGSWVVSGDGSQRRLGNYLDPTWSPHGQFIAGVDDHQLVALEPGGDVRWAITLPDRPRVPSWNSPDGFRIAYVSRGELRVVAGDGTGDRSVAGGASAVRPAWRDGLDHTLAFATSNDRVIAMKADTGKQLLDVSVRESVEGLDWTAEGSLLIWTHHSIRLLDSSGKLEWSYRARNGSVIDGVASGGPQANRFAVLESGTRSTAAEVGPGTKRKVLFAVPGRLADPTWSPNGDWLMVAWPNADQWVFLNSREPEKIRAVSGIAGQFAPGATSQASFPKVTGWCCSGDLK